jgi:hypothetical protein
VIGNVTGNVTGNVIGSASLNVLKTGDTMTGALNVPAGATGSQVPRISEVVSKTGDTMTGALNVPAGATGSQVPRISEVVSKTGDTMTGGLFVSTNTSTDALRVTQTGTGAVLRVEDSTNPDASPFIITNSGSVGIGTSSPTQKLDVSGSANVSNDLSVGGVFGVSDSLVQRPITLYQGIVSSINSFVNIVTFNGAIADKTITGISQDPLIGNLFYLTSNNHGLQSGDFITFSGQTGNNVIFNGTFPITVNPLNDPVNKFYIQTATLPAGALTTPTPGKIVRKYGRGAIGGDFVSTITKNDKGDFTINFATTMADTNYLVFGSASNVVATITDTFTPASSNIGIFQPIFFGTTSLRIVTLDTATTPARQEFPRISVGIVPNN